MLEQHFVVKFTGIGADILHQHTEAKQEGNHKKGSQQDGVNFNPDVDKPFF